MFITLAQKNVLPSMNSEILFLCLVTQNRMKAVRDVSSQSISGTTECFMSDSSIILTNHSCPSVLLGFCLLFLYLKNIPSN